MTNKISCVARELVSPTNGYESSVTDARRISLLICIVFVISGHLFFQEVNRRIALSGVIFYDEILHAIEYLKDTPFIVEGSDTNINFASLSESAVVERLVEMSKEVSEFSIRKTNNLTTFSSPIRSCEVTYYKIRLTDNEGSVDKKVGFVALTERMSVPLSPSRKSHLLVEFPFSCNVFNSEETLYALVGYFVFVSNDEEEIGAVFDNYVENNEYVEDGPILSYRSYSNLKNQLLRIANNKTGKYYDPKHYENAISDLLIINQEAPAIFGISLPTKLTVLTLPVVLVLLTFSFYHRSRRIYDKGDVVWPIIHAEGLIEKPVSFIWRAILILTSVVVYLTTSLYLSPSPELQGSVEFLYEQRYSSDAVSVFSLDLWLTGVKNVYVFPMCLLSVVFILLGFIVLRKRNLSPSEGLEK